MTGSTRRLFIRRLFVVLACLALPACGSDRDSRIVTATPRVPTPAALQPTAQIPINLSPNPPAETGPANLAAAENGGAILSATDELDCCPASGLIDGYKLDEGEWWTSEPPQFPQAVVFDLAGDQPWTIDRVVLNPWTSEWRYAWVRDFEIYVSAASSELDQMAWVGSFTLEHAGIDQTFSFDPVRARYVALVVNSHYGSAEGISLNEFEVYEAPAGAVPVEPPVRGWAGNLAAADNGGRIVDVSSEDSLGNWPASNLIDGRTDTSTGWSTAGTDAPQYVVLELKDGGPYLCGQVVLNPYSDRYEEDWVQDFELWGSADSADLDGMALLGSFTLAQTGEDQGFTFEPVELRYLAVVPLSNYGGTEYALNEIEVYEAGSAAHREAVKGSAGALARIAAAPPGAAAGQEAQARPASSPPQDSTPFAGLNPRELGSGAASDNIEYQVEQRDLVPLIYHLYGPYFSDLVVTTLTNRNATAAKIRVETEVPNYTEPAVDTVILAPGETIEIAQNPPLTPQALDLLHSQKNASVHVQIDYLQAGEERLVYEGTAPLTIYSRADFAWNIPGYYNGTVFLAGMVMPNDPALDELMRVAADYVPGGIITSGYGDEEDSDHSVWNRMKAIYDAVAEYYDVIYVAVGTDFVPKAEEDQGFTLQRLKLPYEVLETHSGMCVELSALFASAYEKIGLRPILITVPRHVYLGVPISWDSSVYYFLETTLVGRATFEEAVAAGNSQFMDEHQALIDEDRLDDYFWLDVSEARQEEIWPIPWR